MKSGKFKNWVEYCSIFLTILLLFIPGLVMGMPLPLIMDRLKKKHSQRIPWAWGLNGFASVVGTVCAILLGMIVGWTATLLAGAGCYSLAALAAFVGNRRLG